MRFLATQFTCALFPLIIFTSLFLSGRVEWAVPRYDAILIICVVTQIAFLLTGFESKKEMKIIGIFHVIGLAMELFKVHMGSWSYPEVAWSKVGGVPLYSGFMYASVASYLCQCWKRHSVHLHRYPDLKWVVAIGVVIYLNFYTHHFMYDLRWVITALLATVFFRSTLSFSAGKKRLSFPLIAGFLAAGLLIWIGENIATYLGAWSYPEQRDAWQPVHIGKISSWFLLVIISFMIVATIRHQEGRGAYACSKTSVK